MRRSISRIIVLSYYHPWIAGGGHRPNQLLIQDLLSNREVVFICASSTDTEDLCKYYSNNELYKNLSILLYEFGELKYLKNCNDLKPSSLEQLTDQFKPDYVRAHNPVESYLSYLSYLNSEKITFVYDQMDYWQGFAVQPWGSIQTEDRYIEAANLITTISKYLANILHQQKPVEIVEVIENAISDLVINKIKSEQTTHNPHFTRKNVIYTGAMWPSWFDWDLCFFIVEKLPQYDFTFIGATHSTSDEDDGIDTKALGIKLGEYPNVKMIAEIPHTELTSWFNKADAAIIPFRINPITLACSPLKVFEYIAAGLPVVSTNMPEISSYPEVYLENSYDDFKNRLLVVDKRKLESSSVIALDNFTRENTWHKRLNKLDDFVTRIQNTC